MNILVIGGGGREHAVGLSLRADDRVKKLYFAPGNGGTSEIGENILIGVSETDKLLDFALQNNIDITIVGPELPLSLGISDIFREKGLVVFGPSAHAAKLETSKTFSKDFMKKYGLPTADYSVYSDAAEAIRACEASEYPVVIKADGLAAGKGVVICESFEHAKKELEAIMIGKCFGASGDTIVIERFLSGKEATVLCFTDGVSIVPTVSSMDHKRVFDGDMGPNTGGMGAVSPARYYTEKHAAAFEAVMQKTLAAIQSEGMDYRGVLYFGLMLSGDEINIIEFNARFGDPETEAVLARLETPLVDIVRAVCDKKLGSIKIDWKKQASACVVIASDGYPGSYKTGLDIDLPKTPENVRIFHAGTDIKNGKLVTSGGRVLAVTALGDDPEAARKSAYDVCEKIKFQGARYRKDIGQC